MRKVTLTMKTKAQTQTTAPTAPTVMIIPIIPIIPKAAPRRQK